jgi:membrane fusion protein (multidrug efflux system)
MLLFWSCTVDKNDASAKSAGQSARTQVRGVIVRPQLLDNIVRSSGTVLPSESVDLVTEVAGRIESISFREGGYVQKNALLVKLNADDLQAQLKKTELQIRLAQEQEQRQKHLLEIEGISKEQYDISLNDLNTLKADYDNLVASLRKREVRAPFDGLIGLRYVSEGGFVLQTTRIASMLKINPVKVDFAIPEKYAGKVRVGDLVHFSNDDSRQRFTGKIFAIEPSIDAAMGILKLRAVCDNNSRSIFPGTYVQIELRLKQITDAIMVPTQAVIPVLKGQSVLVRKGGVVASVPVATGVRTPTSVQIISGLSPGDTVITTGIMQLRPGMEVNVIVE